MCIVGIACGDVLGCILGKSGLRFHIFGKALNRAIELEGICESNRILVCSETKQKCENMFLKFEKHEKEDAFWVMDSIRTTIEDLQSVFVQRER